MLRTAGVLVAMVMLLAGCDIGGGTEGLSAEWMDFDPCELGDNSAAASILGAKEITNEIIDTESMFGEREITGRNCIFDAGGIGNSVAIWFGPGKQPMDRGGRLVDLTGIGDRAVMNIDETPERDGEIMGIIINIGDMSLLVMPPVADTPLEGSAQADEFVEMARVAADRMRAEMAARQ